MIKTLFKYLLANFILIGSGIFIFNSILLPLYVGYNNEHYVPDLRGKDKNKAISILKSMGYKIEIISRPFELINEPNTVLNISPRQFTKVKQGREIKLTVAGERKHVKVPNVIGKSERNATFIIERNAATAIDALLIVNSLLPTRFPNPKRQYAMLLFRSLIPIVRGSNH